MRSTFNTANIAANGTSANILAGDINEFITQRSMVTLYALPSATGIRMNVLASSDVVIDDKELLNIGTNLIIPDQLVDSFAVAAGTRLSIRYRDTAGLATTDVLTAMDVQPF